MDDTIVELTPLLEPSEWLWRLSAEAVGDICARLSVADVQRLASLLTKRPLPRATVPPKNTSYILLYISILWREIAEIRSERREEKPHGIPRA